MTKSDEKLLLLKQLKNRECIGTWIREDDGCVEIHFEDMVVQIDSIEHVFLGPIQERISWSDRKLVKKDEGFSYDRGAL